MKFYDFAIYFVRMEEKEKKEAWWRPAILIFGRVSVWIVVPIIFSLLVGKNLDQRFDTKPWVFLTLSLFGFIISSFGIVFTIKKYIRDIEEKAKIKKDGGETTTR